MNTKLKKAENYFEKKKKRTNSLLSERNFNNTKFLTDNFLAIEIRKPKILINKSVYLEISILDLSKIVMYIMYILNFALIM